MLGESHSASVYCWMFLFFLLLFFFFLFFVVFFFFKQKTAYEIRPRDWSSDVCSSDPFNDASGVFFCENFASGIKFHYCSESRPQFIG